LKNQVENLKVVDNVEEPKIGDHDVVIKVKLADVNPISENGREVSQEHEKLKLIYMTVVLNTNSIFTGVLEYFIPNFKR
jgi:NADPH:quinone reductase-like Zn-dependent oxidoreductase